MPVGPFVTTNRNCLGPGATTMLVNTKDFKGVINPVVGRVPCTSSAVQLQLQPGTSHSHHPFIHLSLSSPHQLLHHPIHIFIHAIVLHSHAPCEHEPSLLAPPPLPPRRPLLLRAPPRRLCALPTRRRHSPARPARPSASHGQVRPKTGRRV